MPPGGDDDIGAHIADLTGGRESLIRIGVASNSKIAEAQFLRILAGFSLHFRCIP